MFQTWFITPHITNRDWNNEPPQNTTERLNATLDRWWGKILQVVQAYNRVSSTYLADRALCCRPDQFIPLEILCCRPDQFIPLEIEHSPPFRSYDRMASSREKLHGVIWWLQKVLVHIGPVHYMPMYERLPYSCMLIDSAHLPLLPLE
jgi:hypothetical protein